MTGSYRAYGVVGPPVTIFIDANGVVAASFAGPLDRTTLNHYLSLKRNGNPAKKPNLCRSPR